jgi:hypothetical protein
MGNAESDSNHGTEEEVQEVPARRLSSINGLPPLVSSEIRTESALCCCEPTKGGTRGNLPQDFSKSWRSMPLKATSNGHGTYEWPDNESTRIGVARGPENGFACCNPSSERVVKYTGEWRNYKKHGRGTQIWADGRKYEGDWDHDNPNGRGTFTWPNGDRYKGEFRMNQRHGRGTLSCADGSFYAGDWYHDMKHGVCGTHTWPDGRRYEGGWCKDKQQGHGIYTCGMLDGHGTGTIQYAPLSYASLTYSRSLYIL